MENNQQNLQQLQKRELDLRILYMFYQNVRSLCLGLSLLFSFFALSQIFFVESAYSNFMAMLNGVTVIFALIILFSIKYEKLPQRYIYQTVSFIILLVFLNTLTLMNLEQEPLWLINIMLMILGVGIFVLSFRWFVFISTSILLATIADLYWGDLSVEMQTSVILLLLAYYFAYVANYLRLSSTKKFQSMYLEAQRNQNQLKMILDEFTQAKNFAEAINQLVPSAIFTINLNNRITSWNNRAEKITGYHLQEMLGKKAYDVFQTDIFEIDYTDSSTVKFEQEAEIYSKRGNLIKILYSIDLLEDDQFYGAIVSFEDVTERRMAEEKLAKSEEQYRTLQTNIPIGIYRSTMQGHLLSANPAMVKMFGYDSLHELMQHNVKDFYVTSQQRESLLEELVHKGQIHRYEAEVRKKDGTHFWVAINSKAIYQNKSIIYFDGVLEDISKRKQAEAELQYQSGLQNILMNISTKYINLDLKDIDSATNNGLRELGAFAQADRAYIFDYDWDKEICINTYEWCAKGISAQIDELQRVPFSAIPQWVEAHSQGEILYIPDIFELDKSDSVRKILEPQQVKSLITIPLMASKKCFGFVGFDSVKKHNTYSDKEVNLLKLFSQIIVNIKSRQNTEKNLAQRDKILQALSVSSNLFLTKKDWQESIKLILEKYGKVLEVDRVYLFENMESADGSMLMKYAHSWQSDKAKSISVNMDQNISYSYRELGFEDWLGRLLNKSSIYGNVNEIAPENKFLRGNKVTSILLVPIFAHDIFWGFIGFDTIESEKKWSQMEVETLTMVADSIGAAISRQANEDYLNQMYNSLLKELDIASSVQHYLLPDWLTQQDEIIFSSTYKPSSLIGGDLFDIIKLASGKTLVYIGDISGHGVQAALMMTAVKSIINMIVTSQEEQLSPSFILQKLNKILAADLFHENYLTILICLIDEQKEEIRYFSAGHPPLIQYDLAQKEVKLIDEGGSIPVGWSLNFDYEPEAEGVVEFSSDKAFMLYTDGIFECENEAGEQFGLEGFHRFIEQHGDFTSAISLPEKFIDILQKQNYDISTDDFTLLTFKKKAANADEKNQKIFTIQPNLENIADIGHKCNQIVRDRLQEEDLADQIELLINEFLSNVIRHGIQKDRSEVIGLEITVSEQVLLTFWDKGIAWELPEKNSDCLMADIDRIGGFGMQIIYSIADEVSLNRLGELNETVMRIGRKENDGK